MKHIVAILLAIFALCAPARAQKTGDTSSPRILKIMTYNLRFGERASMRKIAEEIKAQNPDFVALQELDICTRRHAARANNDINFINELAFFTGMFGHFGRTINLGDGYYGIGILSRHPMQSIDNINLPNPSGNEPRSLLLGHFLLDGTTPIVFASTHLDYQSKETQAAQAKLIIDTLTVQDVPAIVAGDFNSVAGSEVCRLFSSGATLSGESPTFPADTPDKKLDYIFGFPKQAFRLLESGEGPASANAASDHLPVYSIIGVELK